MSKVYSLFPVPLYSNIYQDDISNIVKYFDSCEMNPGNGPYGMISKNTYVVENPICKPLADWILSCFEEFATNIMRYRYQSIKFAQSWLTYKEPGQFHKAHVHPNTLFAGVFYYDFEPGDAAICFSKEVKGVNRSYFEPSLLEDYQNHPYSQEEIHYTPQNKELIIFPSWLTHGVPPNKTKKVRKALGVNALTAGTLGDDETISQIVFSRYAK